MAKYRKKPVVIEAVQVTENGYGDLKDSGIYDREDVTVYHRTHGDTNAVTNRISHVEIDTLEGKMRADLGDWIIVGVEREAYPCKPNIFEATYQSVEEGDASAGFEAFTIEHPKNETSFLLMIEDGVPSILSGPMASIELLAMELPDVTRLRALYDSEYKGYTHWTRIEGEAEHTSEHNGIAAYDRHAKKPIRGNSDTPHKSKGEAS